LASAWRRDLAAFQDLPPALYDACEKKAVRVSSQSLVRYRGTDYSVPTAYGHREVVIRGYVHASRTTPKTNRQSLLCRSWPAHGSARKSSRD
jgi:hypothetical protein